MLQANSEFKRRAKKQLQGKWLEAAILSLIAWLLTTAGGGVVETVQYVWQNGILVSVPASSSFNGISNLLSIILGGPIALGLAGYFLKLIRNEGPIIEDLFEGFKFFIKAFVLNVIITIFTLLWMILLIIPGIVAYFRYSMAYYIMTDNPQLSAFEALTQSKIMMAGYKGKLFRLWLSFLGWFIVGIITLGIGFLWVLPYYNTAKANFYQNLKDNQSIVN